MQVVSITPVRSHLNLKPGVNELSPGYQDFLESIKAVPVDIDLEVQEFRSGKAYQSFDDDRNTLCLFRLSEHLVEENAHIVAHVFSNTLTVVEITFDAVAGMDGDVLESHVQQHSTRLTNDFYQQRLLPLLKKLPQAVKPAYLEPVCGFTGFKDMNQLSETANVKQLWTARFLRVGREECSENAELITRWLEETPNPEHAAQILSGDRNHSMVWLNYVLVDEADKPLDYMIETMCLAHYFYAVQDICNSNLYRVISETHLASATQQAEKVLSGVRSITRLHIATFHENGKYLARKKKSLLEQILGGWEFDDQVANSERLIEVCSSHLQDIHTKRAEKSSFYTDLILVAIGFISLFSLAITLSEYSRAYTASATLGYRDQTPSWMLNFIAAQETDSLLFVSFLSIFITFIVYIYVKRR